MRRLFMDPLFFTGLTDGPEAVLTWARATVAWSREVKDRGLSVATSEQCMHVIHRDGLAPTPERCGALLASVGNVVDGHTLSTILTRWLQQKPYIDDGGYCVVADEGTLSCEPLGVMSRLADGVRVPLAESLLGYAEKHAPGADPVLTPVFATLPLGAESGVLTIAASCILDDASGTEGDVRRQFTYCVGPPSWITCRPLAFYAEQTLGGDDLRLAIECAHALHNRGGAGLAPIEAYRLGTAFVGDFARNLGHSNNERVLQNLALLVARGGERTPAFGLEHYRTGRGGNNPQRVRAADRASAWRVHLIRGDNPVKLHYWLLPSGAKELANIGEGEDFFDLTE